MTRDGGTGTDSFADVLPDGERAEELLGAELSNKEAEEYVVRETLLVGRGEGERTDETLTDERTLECPTRNELR